MDSRLSRSWERVRRAIISRWSPQVSEDDLTKPMTYKQLCQFFGERCGLAAQEAEQEAKRLLDISNRPL